MPLQLVHSSLKCQLLKLQVQDLLLQRKLLLVKFHLLLLQKLLRERFRLQQILAVQNVHRLSETAFDALGLLCTVLLECLEQPLNLLSGSAASYGRHRDVVRAARVKLVLVVLGRLVQQRRRLLAAAASDGDGTAILGGPVLDLLVLSFEPSSHLRLWCRYFDDRSSQIDGLLRVAQDFVLDRDAHRRFAL